MNIETKFDIGQKIWCLYRYWYNGMNSEDWGKFYDIAEVEVTDFHVYDTDMISYIFEPVVATDSAHSYYEFELNELKKIPRVDASRYIINYYLFVTREEAEERLKELKAKENKL